MLYEETENQKFLTPFPFFQYISWVEEKKLPSKAYPSKSEWLRITAVWESTVFGINVVKTTAQTRVWATPSYRKPRDCISQCLRMSYASQNEAKWLVFDSPCIQTNQYISLKYILLSEKVPMKKKKQCLCKISKPFLWQGREFFSCFRNSFLGTIWITLGRNCAALNFRTS